MLFNSKKVSGYIKYFGLEKWWFSLTKEQQQAIKSNCVDSNSVDETNIMGTSMTAQGFLGNIAGNAQRKPSYRFIVELVALKALDMTGRATDRHFVFNTLIDFYYKQRDENSSSLEKCLEFCLKDIGNTDAFAKEWKKEFKNSEVPRMPSFDRAVRIYERRGQIQKALEICEIAMKKLDGSQKVSYSEWSEKLKKKL